MVTVAPTLVLVGYSKDNSRVGKRDFGHKLERFVVFAVRPKALLGVRDLSEVVSQYVGAACADEAQIGKSSAQLERGSIVLGSNR